MIHVDIFFSSFTCHHYFLELILVKFTYHSRKSWNLTMMFNLFPTYFLKFGLRVMGDFYSCMDFFGPIENTLLTTVTAEDMNNEKKNAMNPHNFSFSVIFLVHLCMVCVQTLKQQIWVKNLELFI